MVTEDNKNSDDNGVEEILHKIRHNWKTFLLILFNVNVFLMYLNYLFDEKMVNIFVGT